MSAPQPRYPLARTRVPLSCWAEDLVGGRGAVRALVSWLVLVLLTGMAFVAGLGPSILVVLALGTAAVLLVREAGCGPFVAPRAGLHGGVRDHRRALAAPPAARHHRRATTVQGR